MQKFQVFYNTSLLTLTFIKSIQPTRVPAGYKPSPAISRFSPFSIIDAAVFFIKDFLSGGAAVAISQPVELWLQLHPVSKSRQISKC